MAEAGGSRRARLKRSIAQIGWIRLVLVLLFLAGGLYLARYSWSLPLAGDAERGLYDLRFNDQCRESATSRIRASPWSSTMTRCLRDLGKRSPLDRHTLARALRALDRMEPRAIGIDILIDQAQPEDEELIAAFRGLRTPTFLAFAHPCGKPVPDRGLAGRIDAGLPDPDRPEPAAARQHQGGAGPMGQRHPALGRPDPRLRIPLLANAMTSAHPEFVGYTGRNRIHTPAESRGAPLPESAGRRDRGNGRSSREAAPELFDGFAAQIRGRYILIGGDINDLDDFETPTTRFDGRSTKGLEVHAQMLAQQLDGRMRSASLARCAVARRSALRDRRRAHRRLRTLRLAACASSCSCRSA